MGDSALPPLLLRPGDPIRFPDPRRSDADGLVAVGGDLAADRLLAAYAAGIFPWFGRETPPLWWSPDPRAVLQLETLHVSRRLARRMRQRPFTLTWNQSFGQVMWECVEQRDDGVWIVPEMIKAYTLLHRVGHAHSIEVWRRARLVGGLYGVQRGRLFAAESMFSRENDASKIALVSGVRALFRAGVELFDVQFVTPHLASLGARSWPRETYLAHLPEVVHRNLDLSNVIL